jgi:Kef-type K+ transport system membrane component KefB
MGAVLSTWITFFIVSVAAGRLGFIFPKIGLPLITGYLVIGSIAGPYVLGLIKTSDIDPLSYVTQFALAFIAFSAGAELYLPEIRYVQSSSFVAMSFERCRIRLFQLAVQADYISNDVYCHSDI